MRHRGVQELPVLGRTLVVGQRTNVMQSNENSQLLYLPKHVTTAARERGHLHKEDAEDYFFIAGNNFPWDRVADVVVGLRAYDNYLVGLAIQQNVTVIDATETLLALHQTDRDRHRENEFNLVNIGKFPYNTGLTTSAQYATRFAIGRINNGTKVILKRRDTSRVIPRRRYSYPSRTVYRQAAEQPNSFQPSRRHERQHRRSFEAHASRKIWRHEDFSQFYEEY